MKVLPTIITVAILGSGALMADEKNMNSEHKNEFKQERMHKGQMKKRRNNFVKKALKELNLTSEQKSKIKTIRKNNRTAMKTQRQEHKGEGAVYRFINSNGFDKSGFVNMAKEKAAKRATLRGEMFEKIMEVLTPAQRIELSKKIPASN